MASRLHRTSSLARIGGGAGIGALALVTGACSPGGESSSTDYGVDAPAEEAASAEPRTDSDMAAPAEPAAAPAADSDMPATDSDAPAQPAEAETGGEAASSDAGG